MSSAENTKSNGLLIAVIVLLIILICAVGFLIYQNYQDKNVDLEQKDPDVVEKDQIRELNKAEIEMLKSQIEIYNEDFSDYYPLVSLDKLTNQELLAFASVRIVREDDTNSSFTAEQVNKVISKYFGNNVKLTHEDIICQSEKEALYIYDKNANTYSFNDKHPGHGGGGISYNEVYYFNGSVKNEKEITFEAKVLYEEYCDEICGPNTAYYANYLDSINHTNPILKNNTDLVNWKITDSDYEKIKDQVPVTTYTFTKDSDGNYGLKNVNIQK